MAVWHNCMSFNQEVEARRAYKSTPSGSERLELRLQVLDRPWQEVEEEHRDVFRPEMRPKSAHLEAPQLEVGLCEVRFMPPAEARHLRLRRVLARLPARLRC